MRTTYSPFPFAIITIFPDPSTASTALGSIRERSAVSASAALLGRGSVVAGATMRLVLVTVAVPGRGLRRLTSTATTVLTIGCGTT